MGKICGKVHGFRVRSEKEQEQWTVKVVTGEMSLH